MLAGLGTGEIENQPPHPPYVFSKIMKQKRTSFWVQTAYIYLRFRPLYEYLYLVWKYFSIEIIIFIVCSFKYRSRSRKYYWYFIIILGFKISGAACCHIISAVAATSPKTRRAVTTPAEVRCIRFSDTVPETNFTSLLSLLFFITYLVLICRLLLDTHIFLLQQ